VEVALALLEETKKYNDQQVSLSGFSSGGGIALALSNLLGPKRVCSVVAFYPMMDLENKYSYEMSEVKHRDAIEPSKTDKMKECYVVAGTDVKDPRLTLRHANIDNFPDSVTIVCGNGDT